MFATNESDLVSPLAYVEKNISLKRPRLGSLHWAKCFKDFCVCFVTQSILHVYSQLVIIIITFCFSVAKNAYVPLYSLMFLLASFFADYISFSAHTDFEQTSEFIRILKPPHIVSTTGNI